MPPKQQHTAARAPVHITVAYVAVLTLKNGRTCRSVPLSTWDVADSIGRFSLLDRGVRSYRVEAVEVEL